MKGWYKLAPAAIVLWATVLGGLGSAAAQTKPEGEMRFALYVTIAPVWLDPGETGPGNLTPFWMLYALHDALVKPMPGNRMAPSLAEGWTARIRSYSMNAMVGDAGEISTGGTNQNNPKYMQFFNLNSVQKPTSIFIFLDEHPDSINDGYFVNNDTATSWQDIPASYHNGACGFSFADGHAEIKKWRSATSKYPVQYFYPAQKPFDAAGQADFQWYRERTGMVSLNGVSAYGY